MEKKQTAIDWLATEILKLEGIQTVAIPDDLFHIAKQMEREQMIDLVQSLKDYTYESDCVLGYDEREASEFVDIHYTQTFKP